MAFDFAREVWRKHPTPLGWKPATSSNRGKVSTNVGPKRTTLHRSVSFSLSHSLFREPERRPPNNKRQLPILDSCVISGWPSEFDAGTKECACKADEIPGLWVESQTNLIVRVKSIHNGSSKLACTVSRFGWRFTEKHCKSSLGLLLKWNLFAEPCKRTWNRI